ncbi:MAG: Holliday junction branch migration protein RuvA [Gemmatimonadota bacterium]
MISRLRGVLVSRTESGVEIATGGGVVYEVDVPLSVAMRLPPVGDEIELRTSQVVREDSLALYGFLESGERILFQTLMGTSGVGARLALAMLSTYPAGRLAKALIEKDIGALVQVSGVGKKTAERLALELSDRVKDLDLEVAPEATGGGTGAHEAIQALVALGMAYQDADRSVREVLEDDADLDSEEIIRRALARQ